jgi:solute carrier family 25 carnitine/acylcarnitine transporter 20/29
MTPDFWAGYISGIAGLLIGNPLDIVKVRLQAGTSTISPATEPIPRTLQFSGLGSLLRGSAAPVLGSGALNSILFVSYNRATDFLNPGGIDAKPTLSALWVAGAVAGLATWVVSTPVELIKCRTQLSSSGPSNSWVIAKQIFRTQGIQGLYFGGTVTALRDSIGYGWYFWSYELSSRFLLAKMEERGMGSAGQTVAKDLLCGGLAGVVTWASVFPLDVIKTRVQAQVLNQHSPLLGHSIEGADQRRLGAVEIAKLAYRNEGASVFFKGLGICSLRAFFVNAAQWAVYQWIMRELGPQKATSSMSDKI